MSDALIRTKDPRIKRRGEWYYARFTKNGILVNESLATRSFEVAKAVAEEIERCLLLGVDWKKSPELLDEAWAEFLEAKVTGNKTRKARRKTLSEYIQFGDRFILPHLKDERMSMINESTWEELVATVRKEKPTMLFFNLRKYFSGFLSWAKRKGKIKEMPYLFDPDLEGREAREEAREVNIYSREQLEKLRTAAKSHGSFYVFMLMAQYMGMRPGEITQLKRARLDWKENVIRLKGSDTKTHGARIVPIHPSVLHDLRALAGSHEAPYLFPNRVDKSRPMDRTGFKKVWSKILSDAGVDGVQYDFRKTFITHSLLAGMNPVVVAKMTGTSLRVIEKHYLELRPDDFNKEIGRLIL